MPHQSSGVRIVVPKKQASRISIIIIFLLSLFLLYQFLIYPYYLKNYAPVTSYEIYNTTFSFRSDLRKADKIPVYPADESIYNEVRSTYRILLYPSGNVVDLKNITIEYETVDQKGIYAVEAFELTYKLSMMYRMLGVQAYFDSKEIDSYQNVNGSANNLVIVLVHPNFTNETNVRLVNHAVFISGKNLQEFDLATVKFLMVALGIKI